MSRTVYLHECLEWAACPVLSVLDPLHATNVSLRSGTPAQNRIVFIVVSEGHIFLSFLCYCNFCSVSTTEVTCVYVHPYPISCSVYYKVGLNRLKSTEFTGLLSEVLWRSRHMCGIFYLFIFKETQRF